MICPRCNGGGMIDLAGRESESDTVVQVQCVTCKGEGEINSVQYMMYKQEVEMWCQCGNPSGNVDHYEDGEHPDLGMRHIRCKDCGKVLQVG